MKLDEYIKETLIEIADGISSAREVLTPKGYIVNPSGRYEFEGVPKMTDRSHGINSHNFSATVVKVTFKVQAQLSEEFNVDGTIKGGFLNVISSSIDGQKNSSSSSIQELGFDIVLQIPPGK